MSATVMPRSSGRAPRVEPKLQARRIEVARHQGRRRLRFVVLVLGVVIAVVAVFGATRSPALDVDHVVVRGADQTGAAAVRRASGVPLGRPLVSVDPAHVEARLERLPWVERASVARSWPGTVRITLTERTPIAVVGTGSAAVVVDGDGRAIAAAHHEDLPVVAGAPVAVGRELAAPRRSVVSILEEMPAALRREVAAAHATPSGIALTLTDDITVRWGDSSQPSAKADALAVLLEQADRSTIAGIDVSVPRAATVTRT